MFGSRNHENEEAHSDGYCLNDIIFLPYFLFNLLKAFNKKKFKSNFFEISSCSHVHDILTRFSQNNDIF